MLRLRLRFVITALTPDDQGYYWTDFSKNPNRQFALHSNLVILSLLAVFSPSSCGTIALFASSRVLLYEGNDEAPEHSGKCST